MVSYLQIAKKKTRKGVGILELFQLEDLPEGSYRMAQLYIDNKPYIYFADADTYAHARDILAAILERHELGHKVVQLRHGRGPASEGERYSACGMGTAICTTAGGPYFAGEAGTVKGTVKKLITLSGYSIDYGLSVDEKHLELIKEEYPNVEFLITDYR